MAYRQFRLITGIGCRQGVEVAAIDRQSARTAIAVGEEPGQEIFREKACFRNAH